MANPLTELAKTGQSVWFDQMERKLVSSGKLKQMIDEDDLRGLTSNPTIFEKAIAGSEDYDAQLRQLAAQNKSREEIYDELVIEDIGNAADVFLPVYQRTHGDDGFVSIEVSPLLARDTAGTIAEAKRLFARLGRPNVMIKIPGTPEGLPAIEESIASGININITLIFSNDVYAKVIEAYLRGLERRVEAGLPIGDIASVASFFVSRIDSAADKQLQAKIAATTDPSEQKTLESLLGKVAIANAKLAYRLFQDVFGSARFQKLRDQGARVQRPLWASTGTKNPKYSDVLYVESLIGPDTVDTVPPATYLAFRDHGRVIMTLDQNVETARNVLATFAAKGFSLDDITAKLTTDGVNSFEASFASLMATIEARRDSAIMKLNERQTLRLNAMQQAAVDAAVQRVEKENFVERIWSKDATLWKNDDAHKKIIANALGWLAVVEQMYGAAADLTAFAESVKDEFDAVVVLGMGGSSLCSEVTRRLFGVRDGYPKLLVLDSTVPDAVQQLEEQLDLARTLFIVASKSGTTTEPMMFHRYFYDRVKSVKGDRAGENFVAVTDPDTQLQNDAAHDRFRRTFINPADIGGRYSALSYFGMVPAAISGVDVTTLLDRARHAAHIARAPMAKKNPAAMLGTILGSMALAGRNKLTLITPAPLDTLGLWIEQLIAESTGKEGKGIVPIAGEPQLDVASYGNDRLFVSVRLRSSDNKQRLDAIAAAGHPVVDLVLEDPLDLGETFFGWELATAVAGALLGIDAFDQPNVQESKDNTKRILGEYVQNGALPEQEVVGQGDGITIYAQAGSRGPAGNGDAAEMIVARLLEMVTAGDYVALTEYFAESRERDHLICDIRAAVAGELHVATTTGYGPRFLHSTGQLHKGGADNGVFMQLTADVAHDIPLPGEKFTFGVLARAQALGDFESLAKRGRRALRIHLGADVDAGLRWLLGSVKDALAKKEPVAQ